MIDQSTLECIQALGASNATTSDLNIGTNCSQILDIGLFFDGISRNIEQDIESGKLSNIGRLYSAFPSLVGQSTIAHKFDKYYYSGLGTPFDSSLSDDVVGAGHRVPGEAVGTGEGQLRSSGTDAAKEVLSGGGSGRWYEVFGRSFKVSITQPWNWVKAARDAAIRTGIEAAAPIRDTSIADNLLMSGSHTRLSSAVRDFHNSVADVKQNSELPLARIHVSVFGFDFSAAMAKAFVRRLLDEVCDQDGERFVYQDSDVEVVFVGLLDCVDRTHAEMGLLDWFHPLSPVLDDGGELHPGCQRALHLVAAHERRFYRRCRPLGAENSQWHEELCPGISEDIGGGLVADEQKASAELSRAALHRMYRRATIAGVPFPPLDTLREQNEFTAQMFELNDQVEGYSLPALARHYQRYTNSLQSPTAENFRSRTLVYLAWLAQRYRDYQDTLAALEAREDALPNRYYHCTIGSLVASISGEQEEWSLQRAEQAEIDAAIDSLKQSWGWLEDVDSEARDIRRRERSSDRNTYLHARATLRNHSQLANSWYQWAREESPPALPKPVGLLFAYGLHDKQPEEMTYRNRQPSQLVGGYRFMTWRGIDQPEE